jgi:hypothetical protein
MDDFKRTQYDRSKGTGIGPGGWNCYCCGPHTQEGKKIIRRKARRRMRQDDKARNNDLDNTNN